MTSHLRGYYVHGMRLRLEAQSPALAEGVDALLGAFAENAGGPAPFVLEMRYGTPRPGAVPRGMRRTWEGVPPGGVHSVFYSGDGLRRTDLGQLARLTINLPRRRARILVKRGAEWCLSRNCIVPLLCEFLAEARQYVVHAASLAEGGARDPRAVVVTGRSGMGKTTTALALAHGGLSLMADDATFASGAGGVSVWGLPRPCKVHANTLKMMPWLDSLPRRPAPDADEYFVDLASLPSVRPGRTARPGLVLFLEKRNSRGHRLVPMDKATALIALVRENLSTAHGGGAFEAFSDLILQSGTYRLSVGPRLDTLGDRILSLLRKPAAGQGLAKR